MSNTDEEQQMSDMDLAAHFGESVRTVADRDADRDADRINSIYKVNARIKNYARSNGLSLTSAGESLCNTFTHMILELYQFAESLPEDDRKRLETIVRKQEQMPGDFIAMAFSNQTLKKVTK